MQSNAKTVEEYLKELPVAWRLTRCEASFCESAKGYEECMSYGMIGYVVPHSIYPNPR